MFKLILVGAIAFLLYRFWDNKPALPESKQEEDDPGFAEYEELD